MSEAKQTVDVEAAYRLVSAAVHLAGDDVRDVLALLMASTGIVLLTAHAAPEAAIDHARQAGPALAEAVTQLAERRLVNAKVEGAA